MNKQNRGDMPMSKSMGVSRSSGIKNAGTQRVGEAPGGGERSIKNGLQCAYPNQMGHKKIKGAVSG